MMNYSKFAELKDLSRSVPATAEVKVFSKDNHGLYITQKRIFQKV